MNDIQKLKALAEAATVGDKPASMPIVELIGAMDSFRAAANPVAVLELIEEIEVFGAVAAQPGSLNAMPSSDYDGLKRQFFALRNYALCKDKLAGYYSRELESLCSVDRSQSADEIDAERSINEQLTNDLLQVEGERDQLKAENESLRQQLAIPSDVLADCEALRLDAERYRWLREQEALEGGIAILPVGLWVKPAMVCTTPFNSGEMTDSVVDAAMSKEASHG